MKPFLLKYPVAAFIGLTFFISYLIGLPLKLFSLNQLFAGNEIAFNYFSKLLIVCGPALAALIITGITEGKAGVKLLLKTLVPDTRHIIWWISLPAAGMAITLIAFVAGKFTVSKLLSLMIMVSPLLLLAHIVAAVLIIGIGEELGWRGWLLPKLIAGRTPMQATLFVFAVWALWHGPVFLNGYKTYVPFIAMVFSLSVIFTWLWDRVSGNMFVLVLAHACVDFPEAFFESRIGSGHNNDILTAWTVMSAIFLVIALGILARNWKWWNTVLVRVGQV